MKSIQTKFIVLILGCILLSSSGHSERQACDG